MQKLSVVLLISLTLSALLPAQQRGGGRGPQRGNDGPTLTHFWLTTETFTSTKVTQGDAGYTILLPKGYADEANKDVKYPWILWLPGFGGPNDVLTRGGAEVLDRLRGEGKIEPVALVVFRAPSGGGGRRGGGRTTYMNGEAAGDVEDLVTTDLVEHLQQKYRLATERKHRAVMGESAGGFGALKIALRHPDVFGTVAVHSAAILPKDPADLAGMNEQIVQRQLRGGLAAEFGNPIDKAKWAAHMPLAIVAAKKPEELKGLHVYFDAGTDDNYGFCPPNEEFDQAMTANGHKHLFRKVEGGGHAWGSPSMKECLAVSLQFVGAAFAGKDPIEACKAMAETKPAEAGGDAKKGEAEEKKEDKKEEKKDGAGGDRLLFVDAPWLEVPITLDLGWVWQGADHYFSISR